MDTIYVIVLITTLVLGFVATVLWGPDFEWLGRDVEVAYIFKLVGIGLIVFFLIAINLRPHLRSYKPGRRGASGERRRSKTTLQRS